MEEQDEHRQELRLISDALKARYAVTGPVAPALSLNRIAHGGTPPKYRVMKDFAYLCLQLTIYFTPAESYLHPHRTMELNRL